MPQRLEPGDFIFLDGYERYGGTLGLPVRHIQSGDLRFLTAAHVVGGLSPGRGQTSRVFTGPLRGTHMVGVLIGHSGDSVPSSRRKKVCPVDAALIVPLQHVECSRRIGQDLKASGQYFKDIYDHELNDLTVYKAGARTGLTRGKIAEIGVALRTKPRGDHPGPIQYPLGYHVMSDEDNKHFALPGDSGSIVISDDGKVVGMVVAMHDAPNDPSAYAFVIPIRPILEALGVRLIGN